MHADERKAAVRYWETRRLLYNLLLVPSALAGWFFRGVLSASVGDHEKVGLVGIGLLFLGYCLAANICFSAVYALEFFFGSAEASTIWKTKGRLMIFLAGSVLGFVLAFFGGIQVATFEYADFL
jgi:hypothetical protein